MQRGTSKAQELCERRAGRPGLPVPNKPDGFSGRKTTVNQKEKKKRREKKASQVMWLEMELKK